MPNDISKYFSRHEFACKCGCGYDDINMGLVAKIDNIRSLYGSPISISSGCRCINYNTQIGGEDNSAHIRGMAVDIICNSSRERFMFLYLAILHDFKRIGTGSNFVHLDLDDTLLQKVMWLYK